MSDSPLVSAVIPVFDRAYCVVDAVSSVLDQTYPNVECIVVDDGSSDDGAGAVTSAFSGEPRVKVLSLEHRGVAAARNSGIRDARGEYVTFLDSDDLMTPTRVRRQLDVLKERDCGAVIGRSELQSVNGAAVPGWMRAVKFYTTSLFTETRFVREVGGFDESMRLGEDLDLLVKLRGHGITLAAVDEVFTIQRYFGDNLSYEIDDEHSHMRESIRRHLARRRASAGD